MKAKGTAPLSTPAREIMARRKNRSPWRRLVPGGGAAAALWLPGCRGATAAATAVLWVEAAGGRALEGGDEGYRLRGKEETREMAVLSSRVSFPILDIKKTVNEP